MQNSDKKERIQNVYPARDSERSEYSFSDYNKNDPRSHANQNWQALISSRQNAPIGVFDTGAGGLTVLAALRQELPNEPYIYFGDTAHCPYGERTEDEILTLVQQAIHFLVKQEVKLIVVACNTVSQAALSMLRATFPIPFIGVVPAVKPAARITTCGRIGIAATNRAIQAQYLHQLIEEFASDIQVSTVGCPELVELVERGELEGDVVEEVVRQNLQPLLAKQVDVIVLGCTHFPALRSVIKRVVGEHVQIVDSGAAIARRTAVVLESEGLIHTSSPARTDLQIWCTGDPSSFSQVASKILGYPVVAHQATT
jgi:glutamate racemase